MKSHHKSSNSYILQNKVSNTCPIVESPFVFRLGASVNRGRGCSLKEIDKGIVRIGAFCVVCTAPHHRCAVPNLVHNDCPSCKVLIHLPLSSPPRPRAAGGSHLWLE